MFVFFGNLKQFLDEILGGKLTNKQASESAGPAEGVFDLPQSKKDTRSLEEKLQDVFYFHSAQYGNARRYTVAGKFIKVLGDDNELEEGQSNYELHVVYGIVADGDTFSRKVGREVTTPRLDDMSKVLQFPVSEEELQQPAATFNKIASTRVPLAVFYEDIIHKERHELTDKNTYIPTPGTTQKDFVHDRDEFIASVKKAGNNKLVCEVEVVEEYCRPCDANHKFLSIVDVDLFA